MTLTPVIGHAVLQAQEQRINVAIELLRECQSVLAACVSGDAETQDEYDRLCALSARVTGFINGWESAQVMALLNKTTEPS